MTSLLRRLMILMFEMADKENNYATEQRAYCKIRSLLGKSPTDIKADLDKVYRDLALSYPTVLRWCHKFKNGRDSLEDDPRSGRPSTSVGEKEVTAVKNCVEEDARYTVEEIAGITGLNSSCVFGILKERLHLRKICARWVPHLLTSDQKRQRVEASLQLLSQYENCDQRRLNEIVTGDETWIYFFEPDLKQNNKVWVGEFGERPKIARRNKSAGRVLYALFFDGRGPVAQIPVPEGRSVTGQFYTDTVLPKVVQHYEGIRPSSATRGIKLLHDNAPAHKSARVIEYLRENGIQTLPHPPYSPDLAPCDFWLNPVIKGALRGRKFESRHAVGSAVFQCMNSIPKEDYKNAYQNWIKRLKKCVEVKGEYFEGLN